MARAMLATLFLSDGIPCVTSGDEYGHSRGGRDGAPWAFKNDANAFRWDALAPDAPGADIAAFVAAMAAFRKRRADLFANGGANVRWSGMDGLKAPAWEDPRAPPALMCRRVATPPPGPNQNPDGSPIPTQDVVVAWNGTDKVVTAHAGQPPIGYAWVRLADTGLQSPQDRTLAYVNLAGPRGTLLVAPHAVVVLELAPAPPGTPPTAEQMEAAKRRAARIPDAARVNATEMQKEWFGAPRERGTNEAPGRGSSEAPGRPKRQVIPPPPSSEGVRQDMPARPDMRARPDMGGDPPAFRPPR